MKICCDEMKILYEKYFKDSGDYNSWYEGVGEEYLTYNFNILKNGFSLNFDNGWDDFPEICFKHCPNCGKKITKRENV